MTEIAYTTVTEDSDDLNEFMTGFNQKIFDTMSNLMDELSYKRLCSLHDTLVTEFEEVEGSRFEGPVVFALSAIGEALRRKEKLRAMN